MSERLCKCGHYEPEHAGPNDDGQCLGNDLACPCEAFTAQAEPSTPPSSPALSEARRECIFAVDQAVMHASYNTRATSLATKIALYERVDTLIALAHASGLAAGREQADAEWRKRVELQDAISELNVGAAILDIEAEVRDGMTHIQSKRMRVVAEALAALRSPVGG